MRIALGVSVCARVWSLPSTSVTADGTVLKDKDVKRVTANTNSHTHTPKEIKFKQVSLKFSASSVVMFVRCVAFCIFPVYVYIFMF